ncbi:MAG: hypothetical protein KBT31_00815 [Firmicutes bacterium]|nr:hypothetical protein [Candidatus Colimorpha enterica]
MGHNIMPLEKRAKTVMIILALISLACVLIHNVPALISLCGEISKSSEEGKDVFATMFTDYGSYTYGRMTVNCVVKIVISHCFFAVCLFADRCPTFVIALPYAVSLALSLAESAFFASMAQGNDLIYRSANMSFMTAISDGFFQLVFIAVYLLSVTGVIRDRIAAKVSSVVLGCIPLCVSSFRAISSRIESNRLLMSTAADIEPELTSFLPTVLSLLPALFVTLALLVFLFSVRRNPDVKE